MDWSLSLFPAGFIELLSTEFFGRKRSLREQLLARWQKAWLASNLKVFQNYLKTMHIYAVYSTSKLVSKPSISPVDLQI